MQRYSLSTQFWVIGEVEASGGVTLGGTSLAESQQAVQSTPVQAMEDPLTAFRSGVRRKLEQNLVTAKANFRQRLRGPGAGGGY